jgi:hypothetical protein
MHACIPATTFAFAPKHIYVRNKEEEKTKRGRRGEHKVNQNDYILFDFHYMFWLQDKLIYRLNKG